MQMFACYDKIRTSWLFDYVSENVSGEENTSGPNFGKEFRYYNIEQYWTSICTTIFQKRYFIIPSHNVLMCQGHLKSSCLTNLSNLWCLVLEIQTASSQSKQSKHDKVRRIANVTFVLIQQICLEKGGIMEFISKANTVYGLPVINSLEVLTKALPGINKHSFIC